MDVDYSEIGRLLSSPARSAMLGMLFDGDAGATALARCAGVAPSTASGHLRALVDGGLVSVAAHGRQRRYRISGPQIAEALEALARVCPRRPVRSLRSSQEVARMRVARTCYDHLAGHVGVAVFDALVLHRWLVLAGEHVELGPEGGRFGDLGVDAAALRRQRRCFARTCLDATERRPHLAGALGAALCGVALDGGWLVRNTHGRGLGLTDRGVGELWRLLGVDLSVVPPPGGAA